MVHGVSRTVKFTEIYSAKESEGESEQREMGEKGEDWRKNEYGKTYIDTYNGIAREAGAPKWCLKEKNRFTKINEWMKYIILNFFVNDLAAPNAQQTLYNI